MNALKLAVPLFVALAYGPSQGLAVPILGSNLASFAVLGATGVTNVPTSTIGGNLGSAPNASVGGGYIFTAGSLQANTLLAQNAQFDLDAAILAVNGMALTATIGPDLTGTILPGVYDVLPGPVNLSGALILDGTGFGNTAVWAFRFPSSTLITSTTSTVTLINVGDGANVGLYWSVGTGATLDGFTFAGNVLAQTIASSDGNLTITCGRLLSSETQVTLNQDNISIGCAGIGFGSGGFDQGVAIGSGGTGGSGGHVVPEPGTFLLFGVGLAGLFVLRKKSAIA